MKPTCLTFAGAIGSSKTPIANYLSTKLGLPVFNNDSVRTEVKEDLGIFDETEYLKRRNIRLDAIIAMGRNFIYDASLDRTYVEFKKRLEKSGFRLAIISLDLSREKLETLYQAKGYSESLGRLDDLLVDHSQFLSIHTGEVVVHISDGDFPERLSISLKAVEGLFEKR